MKLAKTEQVVYVGQFAEGTTVRAIITPPYATIKIDDPQLTASQVTQLAEFLLTVSAHMESKA